MNYEGVVTGNLQGRIAQNWLSQHRCACRLSL